MSNTLSTDNSASAEMPSWFAECSDQLKFELTSPVAGCTMGNVVRDLCWLTDEQFREGLAHPALVALKCPSDNVAGWLRVKAYHMAKEYLRGVLQEDEVLCEFNNKFAVVKNLGGKTRVVWEEMDPVLGRKRFVDQSFDDFRKSYCNRRIDRSGYDARGKWVERTVRVGDWWLYHPHRRQFDRLVFAPNKEVPNCWNLWTGYGCLPSEEGDKHQSFLDMVFLVICDGDQDHYDYLVRWMANAVQNPGVPGMVAVVLKSAVEGTGKGFFAREFGKLFGSHFLQVTNAAHVVGNFNAHLRTVVVLFADEALYAGDKRHADILKTLITEPTIPIEAKHKDVEEAPNCVHLIMASNSDHVVRASEWARRFLVLKVADRFGHLADDARADAKAKYFGGIEKDLQDGGYQDLLGYLLRLDLDGFNLLDVPQTEALAEQKELSDDASLWFDILEAQELSANARLRSHDVLIALGVDMTKPDERPKRVLGKVMRQLGFENKPLRDDDGKLRKVWVRGDGSDVYGLRPGVRADGRDGMVLHMLNMPPPEIPF